MKSQPKPAPFDPTTEVAQAAYAAGREVRTSELRLNTEKAAKAGYHLADVRQEGPNLVLKIEQVGPYIDMFSPAYDDHVAGLLGPEQAEAILGAAYAKVQRQVFLALLAS